MHVLNVQGMSGCQTYSNNIALTFVTEYTELRNWICYDFCKKYEKSLISSLSCNLIVVWILYHCVLFVLLFYMNYDVCEEICVVVKCIF